MSRKRVNNILAVLGKMLRYAHEVELLDVVPRVKLLKVPPQEFDFLRFEELSRLLEAVKGDRERTALLLMGGDAGLRQGEMVALEWGAVDLVAGTLTVRRSSWRGIVGTRKSGRDSKNLWFACLSNAPLGEHDVSPAVPRSEPRGPDAVRASRAECGEGGIHSAFGACGASASWPPCGSVRICSSTCDGVRSWVDGSNPPHRSSTCGVLRRWAGAVRIPPDEPGRTVRERCAQFRDIAEREGFEPSVGVKAYARLASGYLRPLGHLSGLPKGENLAVRGAPSSGIGVSPVSAGT